VHFLVVVCKRGALSFVSLYVILLVADVNIEESLSALNNVLSMECSLLTAKVVKYKLIVILKFWLTDGYTQLSMILANVRLNGCLVHLNNV
jgi:hypothetical protein